MFFILFLFALYWGRAARLGTEQTFVLSDAGGTHTHTHTHITQTHTPHTLHRYTHAHWIFDVMQPCGRQATLCMCMCVWRGVSVC